VVTLTANPATGYDLKNWTGTDGDTSNPTTVTMSRDKQVKANFESRFSLIINNQLVIGSFVSFADGSVTVNPAPEKDGKYTSGTEVALTARSDSGYDWKGWIGTSNDKSNPTRVTMSGNVLYGMKSNAWTLYTYNLSNILSSDQNYFFHPYVSQNIAYGPSWTRQTFSQWKTFSGQDSHSKTNWFTQPAGEASRARAFYNNTKAPLTVNLGSRQYLDLDQNPVIGSLTLQPFTSKVLVDNGAAPLTMISISPDFFAAGEANDFTLRVSGWGFTSNSMVRWNGSDRPTVFISPTSLTATISAADVNTVGDYPVTVRDPLPAPGGSETQALMFHVVTTVFGLYFPITLR